MSQSHNKELLETLRSLVNNAGVDGTWNYDPYLHGMFNGMELMLSTVEGRQPEYRDTPDEWLCNKELDTRAISA